jgi:hypothetical protein
VTGGNTEVYFVTYNGRGLFLPAGWRLTPPEPGEPISGYFDRAIYDHQLVWNIFTLADGRELALPKGLDSIRPAERTFEWWRKTYPYSGRDKTLKESLEYDLARLVWRLVVALFDQFRAGDLVVKGRRMDVSTSEVESVERGLWQNDFMVLRPRHRRGGWFGPEVWEEHQPPTTLTESYCELTVWPASKLPTLALVADQAPAGEQARTPAAERGETPTPNKSGRKPERLNAAIAEMVEAVNQGKLTREALQEIPKKKLDEHFSSAKTTTLYLARKEAVRQLASKGIPTES